MGARKGVIVMWVSGALSAPKEMVENKKQKTKRGLLPGKIRIQKKQEKEKDILPEFTMFQ